jgi:cytochrome c5
MKEWKCGILMTSLWLSACAPAPKVIPVATPEMAAASGVPLKTLQRGNAIYLSKCGRCHELIAPDQVKTSDWRLLVPGMCWNAGLTQADEKEILKYVLAAKTR